MNWLRARGRGDEGVTVVEAAIAVPLLLTLLLGVFDVGLWVLQTTQLSGAARDGARAGIIVFKTAEGSAGSTSAPPAATGLRVVNDAVKARLAGQRYALTVACVGASDETTKPCATAEPDVDRIKVVVTYTRSSLTPVTTALGARTVRGTAVMQLVGQPE